MQVLRESRSESTESRTGNKQRLAKVLQNRFSTTIRIYTRFDCSLKGKHKKLKRTKNSSSLNERRRNEIRNAESQDLNALAADAE